MITLSWAKHHSLDFTTRKSTGMQQAALMGDSSGFQYVSMCRTAEELR